MTAAEATSGCAVDAYGAPPASTIATGVRSAASAGANARADSATACCASAALGGAGMSRSPEAVSREWRSISGQRVSNALVTTVDSEGTTGMSNHAARSPAARIRFDDQRLARSVRQAEASATVVVVQASPTTATIAIRAAFETQDRRPDRAARHGHRRRPRSRPHPPHAPRPTAPPRSRSTRRSRQ